MYQNVLNVTKSQSHCHKRPHNGDCSSCEKSAKLLNIFSHATPSRICKCRENVVPLHR